MESNSGYANVNSTNLYYEIAGSGPPLALLHGFSLDTHMWDDQFMPFARRFRVLRYDLRGFGKSALPTFEPYMPVEDLKALLDTVGIDRAILLGLSMGGGVAIDFALTYPERVRALIPVDSMLRGHRWAKKINLQAHEVGAEVARRRWLEHEIFAPAREQPEVFARLEQMVNCYSGWHWNHRDPGQAPDPPAIERLDQIQTPTLVIAGERELPDFHTMTDILAERIPGARKILLRRAGHLSNMEAPQAFNEAVIRFLDGLVP